MNFLKTHYDGVILLASALAAIGIFAFIGLSSLEFSAEFQERNSSAPRKNEVRDAEHQVLVDATERLSKPSAWGSHEGSLMVSRIYVLTNQGLIDPIEGDTPLHPPVPNEWLLNFDLDYSQRDVLETDPDGDGFSVLEEWRAGTDPTDVDSVPPYWTKLRLEDFERIPFKVKFSGSPDGGKTFTINFVDDRRMPTQFVELGQTVVIAGVPYKVAKFQEKQKGEEELFRDVSELTLESVPDGEQIILINDQIMDSPTMFGVFVNALDGERIRVKRGEAFQMQQAPDISFVLKEVSDSQASILDKTTGKIHVVPKE